MKTIKVKEEVIAESWNEAEELFTSLCELTDEEIIECKDALIKRIRKILELLDEYVDEDMIERYMS